MLKPLLIAVALAAGSSAPIADDFFGPTVERQLELKNGATLYVYKDGKMALADRVGRPLPLKPGITVETRDGERVALTSNEVSRIHRTQPDGS